MPGGGAGVSLDCNRLAQALVGAEDLLSALLEKLKARIES